MVWNFRKVLEPDGVRWSVVVPGRSRKSCNLADEVRMPLQVGGGFFWIVRGGKLDERTAAWREDRLEIEAVPDCLIFFAIDDACDCSSSIGKRRDRKWQQRRLPISAHGIARRKRYALDKNRVGQVAHRQKTAAGLEFWRFVTRIVRNRLPWQHSLAVRETWRRKDHEPTGGIPGQAHRLSSVSKLMRRSPLSVRLVKMQPAVSGRIP